MRRFGGALEGLLFSEAYPDDQLGRATILALRRLEFAIRTSVSEHVAMDFQGDQRDAVVTARAKMQKDMQPQVRDISTLNVTCEPLGTGT